MKSVVIEKPGDPEMLITQLWELGTTGIIENANEVQAFFVDDADLAALTGSYTCQIIELPESVPEALSQQCDPIFAGESFVIVSAASSSSVNSPPDRILIKIDAQNAFGSGSHESTQLVISALEARIGPATVMLDVGSGSGILSAVAHHLGARTVFACDTHFDSVLLTQHHAPAANVFAGSVDAMSPNSVDLVVANISARVIDALTPTLVRAVRSDGWLILSGFIAEKPPSFFLPTLEMALGEWRCWICKPQDLRTEMKELPGESLQPFASEWW